MKYALPAFVFLYMCQTLAAQTIQPTQSTQPALPVWNPALALKAPADWLVLPLTTKAAIYQNKSGNQIYLFNGLLLRSFTIAPNVACTGFKNISNGQQLLRAVKPEALVTINNIAYNIGGLYGQKQQAYLINEWVDEFTASYNDFQFQSYTTGDVQPFINYQTTTWSSNYAPPKGKTITFTYASQLPALKNISISVHYQVYDGIPLLVKWLSLTNGSAAPITLNKVVNEVLAVVEEESAVVGTPIQMKKQHGLYVETNYAFNNAMRYDISDQTTHWLTDSTYTSQVNYNFQTPCLLQVYPEKVTAVEVAPGETFKSVRTHELLMDSHDRERRGLAIRTMYRTVAPWTNANPIFMHLVSKTDQEVYNAIDQCAATGYEALILSFGSHCNLEDSSAANIQKWKTLADYAHSKKILIGGYSLFSSRRISDEDDVIDPITGKPDAAAFFGNAPCMGSKWGLAYLYKLKYFITNTGFNIFENDGPYPGDVCASTTHPGHKGLGDSQWRQMELQKGFYSWCSQQGVYVNAPDWYFLDGTNKIAIGYREVNFSLPRQQQMILNRQNIYDGLWEKTPSMSWGFVPLTKYQGGGPEAVLEPLSEHLADYQQLMIQYYGAGVQACYRGPRLYDTETTRAMVQSTVGWYKKYRPILNANLLHLRRADGRDWDGIMHVNPQLAIKALVMLYNPLNELISRTISLPLYYTGLTDKASVRQQEGPSKTYTLDRQYQISVEVVLPAKGYTWLVVE